MNLPTSATASKARLHKRFSSERYAPQFKAKVLKYLSGSEEISQHDDESSDDTAPKKSKCKYGKRTISAAATKFNIHPRTIADWVQAVKRQADYREMTSQGTSPSIQSSDCHRRSAEKSPTSGKNHSPSSRKGSAFDEKIVTVLQQLRASEPINKEASSVVLREKILTRLNEIIPSSSGPPVPGTSTGTAPWYMIWWNRFQTNLEIPCTSKDHENIIEAVELSDPTSNQSASKIISPNPVLKRVSVSSFIFIFLLEKSYMGESKHCGHFILVLGKAIAMTRKQSRA